MASLPCVICNTTFEDAIPGTEDHPVENQPYMGTVFCSYGQYGSTVFDSMNSHFLELNICDKCLIRAANKNQVLEGFNVRRPDTRYKPWTPPE